MTSMAQLAGHISYLLLTILSHCECYIRQQYIGCYRDGGHGNRVMGDRITTDDQMHLSKCLYLCNFSTETFFGVEYRYECHCGEGFDRLGQLHETSCNESCSGNNAEICGGPNAISVYSVCPLGFWGKNCNMKCDPNCKDVDGVSHCSRAGSCAKGCRVGWTDTNCTTDIDECLVNSHECQQLCTNTPGSFQCSCIEGYTLSRDGKTCFDNLGCGDPINGTNGGCDQHCHETDGGYYCSCDDGFFMSDDNRTCTDIDECQLENGGCEHYCHNYPGQYKCVCRDGYERDDKRWKFCQESGWVWSDGIWSSETWSPWFVVLGASVSVAATLTGVTLLLVVLLVRARRQVTRQRVTSQRVSPVLMSPSLLATSAENWLPPADETSDYLAPAECGAFQQPQKQLEEVVYAEITVDCPADNVTPARPASTTYEHLIESTKTKRSNRLK